MYLDAMKRRKVMDPQSAVRAVQVVTKAICAADETLWVVCFTDVARIRCMHARAFERVQIEQELLAVGHPGYQRGLLERN